MINKWFCMTAVAVMLLSNGIDAATQRKVTDLPDISVVGNLMMTQSDGATDFDVKEVEFAFQHYLYPGIKADIFAALHKEGDERTFELEEAFLTFDDLVSVIVPESDYNAGVGAIAGRKLLNFGKQNNLHPEQLDFVDRPQVIQQFLGGEEGLGAEGVAVSYLLPTSFFSQIELGSWFYDAHEHEEEAGEEHAGVEFSDRIFNARLWNSFELSEKAELEFGVSYLAAHSSAGSAGAKQNVSGIDLTYQRDMGPYQHLKVQAEWLQAKYGEDGEDREDQSGLYLSTFYRFNQYYHAGIRYGHLGQHGDEGEAEDQWTFLVTRQLTESSKFRLQFNTSDDEDLLMAQMIFGIGPHSHVLQ